MQGTVPPFWLSHALYPQLRDFVCAIYSSGVGIIFQDASYMQLWKPCMLTMFSKTFGKCAVEFLFRHLYGQNPKTPNPEVLKSMFNGCRCWASFPVSPVSDSKCCFSFLAGRAGWPQLQLRRLRAGGGLSPAVHPRLTFTRGPTLRINHAFLRPGQQERFPA